MSKSLVLMAVFSLASGPLPGQSPAEWAQFIVQEIRAGGPGAMEVKEAGFGPGQTVFKLTTAHRGQLAEQTLELTLAEVDIYTERTLVHTGTGDFTCTYTLVATPRGRADGIRQNLGRTQGPVPLVGPTPNGARVLGLERVFGRLTELVSGRHRPLPLPPLPDLP